jgi:tetratricopeptide (TPR) repeat protein
VLAAARKKPEDSTVWDRVDELCRDLDRPEEAAALYSEVMESKAPIDVRIEVGLRAADFCEEWFENTDPVLEMLSRVLVMAPTHKVAFERLTVLLTVAGRWSDLLTAYDSALAASESDVDKAHLLEEAAKVARDFAGDSELGSTYMKALLLLRPKDDQLATVLEKRLDEQGRHQDLIDVWTARLAVIEPGSALALMLAIAARLEGSLLRPAEALAVIDAFEAKGGSMAEAIPVLGRIAAPSTAQDDLRREALWKLKRIYEAARDFPNVVCRRPSSIPRAEP